MEAGLDQTGQDDVTVVTPEKANDGGTKIGVPKPSVWRPAFLTALRNSGNVRAASQAAHISRKTAYEHKKKVQSFSADWEEALADAVDILEAAAWQRARGGKDQPPSDTLLIFLLKSHRPEVYMPRQRIEHTGPEIDGRTTPIPVSLVFDHADFLDGGEDAEPEIDDLELNGGANDDGDAE